MAYITLDTLYTVFFLYIIRIDIVLASYNINIASATPGARQDFTFVIKSNTMAFSMVIIKIKYIFISDN